MAKEIKWSKEAEDTFDAVIAYLEAKWTAKEISNFVNAASKTIFYISENPYLFRQSGKYSIREALVTKHNFLLYRIKPKHIELLVFWDTRKNPRKKFRRKK